MKRLTTLLFLSISMPGCQSQSKSLMYWYKPDTTLEQAIKDCKQCRERAHGDAQAGHYDRYHARTENPHSVPYSESTDRFDRDIDDLHSFRSCMRQLGYTPVLEHRLGADVRKTYRFGGNEIQHIAGK